MGWIGVDLDGTLAEDSGWKGPDHIGKPVMAMVQRIRDWFDRGQEVKIFTARVAHDADGSQKQFIQQWCYRHIGFMPEVTCTKDYGMIELWDDRAVQVVANTGRRADEGIKFDDLRPLEALADQVEHDLRLFDQHVAMNGKAKQSIIEMRHLSNSLRNRLCELMLAQGIREGK